MFKIRIYNNFSGRMINSNELKEPGVLETFDQESQDFTFMESSGFYDQEGKEIYDGDIVFHESAKEYGFIRVRENTMPKCFICHFKDNSIKLSEIVADIRVVGNLSENLREFEDRLI